MPPALARYWRTHKRGKRTNPAEDFPEILARALRYEKTPGYDWSDAWFRTSEAERKKFEKWLIDTKDPLAWQAGTREGRFRVKVRELTGAPLGTMRYKKTNPRGAAKYVREEMR